MNPSSFPAGLFLEQYRVTDPSSSTLSNSLSTGFCYPSFPVRQVVVNPPHKPPNHEYQFILPQPSLVHNGTSEDLKFTPQDLLSMEVKILQGQGKKQSEVTQIIKNRRIYIKLTAPSSKLINKIKGLPLYITFKTKEGESSVKLIEEVTTIIARLNTITFNFILAKKVGLGKIIGLRKFKQINFKLGDVPLLSKDVRIIPEVARIRKPNKKAD